MPPKPHTYASVNEPARLAGPDRTAPNSGTRATKTVPHTGGSEPHRSAQHPAIVDADSRKSVTRCALKQSQTEHATPYDLIPLADREELRRRLHEPEGADA
jgi:hypothetical protein